MQKRTYTLLITLFALTGAYNYGLSLNPLTLFGLYEPKIKVKINAPEVSGIKHVIFDLDGVIFTTSKRIYTKIAPYFPLYFIRKMYECQWKGVKQDYLNTLSELEAEATEQSFHDGKAMPQIMIDWQTGTNVFDSVEQQLQDSKSLPYAYKKLMLAIASNVFNPVHFINSRTVIPEGVKILQALKKNGYKVYVLSNWDAQSFPLLEKKYPEIMGLFDGVLISGEAKTLKPHKEMFMQFLDKFNLNAEDCIFIDDEQHNVTAAQEKAKIASVLFDKKNIKTAIERLQELYIFKTIEQTHSQTTEA